MSAPAGHECMVKKDKSGPFVRAVCECGWVGLGRIKSDTAESDIRTHHFRVQEHHDLMMAPPRRDGES